MAKVSMSVKLPASADAVWDVVKGFNDLPRWLPPVATSETDSDGVGSKRTLTLGDGTKLVEQLNAYDDGSRSYSYSIVESPLPLANYNSTIKIAGSGEGAEVEWTGEFDPQGASEGEVREIVEGVYKAGLDNLKKMFGG